MSEALKKIEDYPRIVLRELYNQLTGKQKKLFFRGYGSLGGIQDHKINGAIQLCERTIAAARKKENE